MRTLPWTRHAVHAWNSGHAPLSVTLKGGPKPLRTQRAHPSGASLPVRYLSRAGPVLRYS
ncbi:hypothetical protein T484DRAFT_3222323 [Baffinella frigidus]|nr:hypothetical protein T484DRAFT_3222323 [Cryptophyta sp. CCMP2293]